VIDGFFALVFFFTSLDITVQLSQEGCDVARKGAALVSRV
jgi:hypothetical protein